ncbi:MAG: 3'-5' exonuclease [Candidatus Aenigmatarchaeota archaeon]
MELKEGGRRIHRHYDQHEHHVHHDQHGHLHEAAGKQASHASATAEAAGKVHEGHEGKAAEKPAPEKKKGPFCKSKEEIMRLPLGEFRGRIILAYTHEGAERAAHELLREKMLGFDTETKPNFVKGRKQNPIGLIQISTLDRAYLFRVNETGMTPGLRMLLESPHVVKIGQAMKHELLTMKKELQVTGRGFIDLLDIAHKLECDPKNVRAMTGIFLGFRISKSMQVTNWEARVLSEKQKRYAATDAWACLAVYREIERRGLLRNIRSNIHR